MNEIVLIKPNEKFKMAVEEYKKEFEDNNEELCGTAGLNKAKNFDEWISAIEDNSSEETAREGLVPASTYLAIRAIDGKLLGMIDVRHRLNEYLLQFGGNIGYSIRKSERRKGYGKEMLRQALEKCKDMNINKVLITCDRNNIASANTIKSQGGILENEVREDNEIIQRYWINLK